MIQLGRTQELEIVREVKFGVYLAALSRRCSFPADRCRRGKSRGIN